MRIHKKITIKERLLSMEGRKKTYYLDIKSMAFLDMRDILFDIIKHCSVCADAGSEKCKECIRDFLNKEVVK